MADQKGSLMTTRQTLPFAIDREGTRLFVRLDYIASPQVAVRDGLSLWYFGRSKRPYITVEQAIEWTERQCREVQRFKEKRGAKMLEALREARHRFLTKTFEVAH